MLYSTFNMLACHRGPRTKIHSCHRGIYLLLGGTTWFTCEEPRYAIIDTMPRGVGKKNKIGQELVEEIDAPFQSFPNFQRYGMLG
jgi:hypothetical protein